jgi:O-antigen ligase
MGRPVLMGKKDFFSIRHFIVFIALTPFSVFITKFFGAGANVVTTNPWLAMSAWLLIGSIVFLAYGFIFSRITLTVTRSLLPLILYMAWMVLSLIWAQNTYMGVIHLLYWVAALFGFLFLTQKAFTYSDYILFAKSMYLSGFGIACLGLLQYYVGLEWIPQAAAPAAVFINKNMAAQYILLTIPFALTKYSVDKTKFAMFFTFTSAALMVWFLLVTEARAPMLGLSVILIILLARAMVSYKNISSLKIKSNYIGLALISFLIVTVVFLAPYLNEVYVSLTESLASGERTSINIRVSKWLNAGLLFKDNWLVGIGINNWYNEYPAYHQIMVKDLGLGIKSTSEYAHNDAIQIAVELGVIGLMLYTLLICSVLRSLWIIYKSKDSEKIFLALPLVLVLVGIYSVSMFSFPGRLPHSIFLIVMCFALISRLPDLSIQGNKAKKIKNTQYNSYTPSKNVGFCLLLLLALSIYGNYRLYQGEIWYRITHQYYSAGKHYYAMKAGDKAVAYDPYRYETLKYRANAYQRAKSTDTEKMIIELYNEYPNSLNTLHRLVGYYSSQKEFDKALQYALYLKKIAPQSDWVHHSLILIYDKMGLVEQRKQSVKDLGLINPDHFFLKNN